MVEQHRRGNFSLAVIYQFPAGPPIRVFIRRFDSMK
jgi:hypothetical protein